MKHKLIAEGSLRTSKIISQVADRLIALRQRQKKEISEKSLAFFRMNYKEKIEFLKEKLYKLYDHKLRLCEENLNTNMVDRDIDRIEKQIQDFQVDMWE